MAFDESYDVVVVGGGNAGFSAATTAAQYGAQVCLVEKAPLEDAGGNTFYTAAAFRCCFDGLEDLLPNLYQRNGTKGLPQSLISRIEMAPYTKADFHADINRVTKGRADPMLADLLVDNSREAVQWLMDNGAHFVLSFNRQAYFVNGKYKFWGGMVLNMAGQGKELFEFHLNTAKQHDVVVRFSCPAVDLISDSTTNEVIGLKILREGKVVTIGARGGVVLASGGFQASPALRAQYLGPGWDLAHVRGSKYNTGDGHTMAKKVGARLDGNYSGCHSVAWDANSPRASGNRILTNQYTKSGYPLGIMVNIDGKRFVDEGFDLRNFTYAIFGKEILKQPQGIAFQVWDRDGSMLLRHEEYADDVTMNIRAETLDQLADILMERGLKDRKRFLETIAEFNEACKSFQREHPEKKFDPSAKDGMSTQGTERSLPIGKTNWAAPIEHGPFQAVEVTCGITFTFGGLAVTSRAEVISELTGNKIRGLWCAGELLGGLFWDNYPGGSGLTMGTVMGMIAGREAAERADFVVRTMPNKFQLLGR
ncbi:FAD/NAD(P)-binding domain-containing protein [Annulohypoxylon truncatum]|uniref:FAD/NAD(P)-binding domain-containing protein n=1 Tax=Annulohypoxylon truncatum TaxID=327061 RepID=UPI002008996F|nr:FAD/NAD(P)-binding domain-containing protein [Annulohypoxylon truncatum]KAI1207495.1 FAD/NAD(P)-binding domain-containing protein [Annulohypoxylon truncatum]